LRKEFQKKEDRRCWADPPPFRPSWTARPAPPPLSLPRAAPASLHPAPATWRLYAGVGRAAADRLHLVRTPPRAPGRSTRSVARASLSSSSIRERSCSRSSSARAIAGKSPAAHRRSRPEPQPRHQDHHRTRLRRGKPVRTLYRGEKPLCAVNRSSELLRPRRRAPPRRILLDPTSFHSLLAC